MCTYCIMNYIHKRRNEVISINNTAQKELEDMVQMLDVDNITQLNVSKYLSGDINLKFIEEKCPNLVDIIFEKGDITSVFNIPKNTKKTSYTRKFINRSDRIA